MKLEKVTKRHFSTPIISDGRSENAHRDRDRGRVCVPADTAPCRTGIQIGSLSANIRHRFHRGTTHPSLTPRLYNPPPHRTLPADLFLPSRQGSSQSLPRFENMAQVCHGTAD